MTISFLGLWLSMKSGFSFQEFQSPRDHFALLRSGELGDHAIGELEKDTQGFELLVKGGGFGTSQTFGAGSALFQDFHGWTQFAAAPFPNDNAKHSPDIFFSFEKFFPLPFPDDATDKTPTDQIA